MTQNIAILWHITFFPPPLTNTQKNFLCLPDLKIRYFYLRHTQDKFWQTASDSTTQEQQKLMFKRGLMTVEEPYSFLILFETDGEVYWLYWDGEAKWTGPVVNGEWSSKEVEPREDCWRLRRAQDSHNDIQIENNICRGGHQQPLLPGDPAFFKHAFSLRLKTAALFAFIRAFVAAAAVYLCGWGEKMLDNHWAVCYIFTIYNRVQTGSKI